MCSIMRGPAMAPSLVTWSMTTTGILLVLAKVMSRAVPSRICPMLPGVPSASWQYIVWMESTISRRGFRCSASCSTASSDVSACMNRSGVTIPSLWARSLICPWDSSPDPYRTVPCFLQTAAAICSTSVDLPMPGSPLSRIRAPGTNPPPSTRSSSPIPVSRRDISSMAISVSAAGRVSVPVRCMLPALRGASGCSVSSVIVFHSPHWGQRPSQRLETLPQLAHT